MRVKRCDKRFRQHRSAFAGATCHFVSMWYVSLATRTKCVCYAHFHHSIMLIQLQHMLSYKHICPPAYDRIVLWIITHNISYHIILNQSYENLINSLKFPEVCANMYSMYSVLYTAHTHTHLNTDFIEKSHWQLHKCVWISELNSLYFVWLAIFLSFCLEHFFRPFSVYRKIPEPLKKNNQNGNIDLSNSIFHLCVISFTCCLHRITLKNIFKWWHIKFYLFYTISVINVPA